MQLKTIKISIITPSFNQGQFIEETISSVIEQNYPSLEFIIIDGGSTDNTLSIIRKYEEHITKWISEPDKGTANAVNKALEIFTGDIWCVLNSDDVLLPGTLQKVADFYTETKADWITGGVHAIDENSVTKAKIQSKIPKKTAALTFATNCWIYHSSTFLSRKVFEKASRFSEIDILDYDYWLRLEQLGFFPEILPDFLSGLRFHKECKSFDFLKIYNSNTKLLIDLKNKLNLKLSSKDYKEITERIKESDLLYFQSKIKSEIFQNERIKSLKTMMKLLSKYPEQLKKRWFWGALKAHFTGISEKDFHPHAFLESAVGSRQSSVSE